MVFLLLKTSYKKDMNNNTEIEKYFRKAEIAMVLEEEESFPVLKECIDKCPKCAQFSDGNETLLHSAAQYGTPEMIEYIVNAGGDVSFITEERNPLCKAISARKLDNVKKLIELGAAVNCKELINSPVLNAILVNSLILEWLIEAGADLTYQYKSKDNLWWNALTFALYRQEKEAIKIIERELVKQNIDFSSDVEIFKTNLENVEQESNKQVDYTDYIENNLGAIQQYYDHEDILEVFLGGVSPVSEDVAVSIYGILPKNKDYGILITSGMSEYPMAETDEGLQYAEVMMKIPGW